MEEYTTAAIRPGQATHVWFISSQIVRNCCRDGCRAYDSSMWLLIEERERRRRRDAHLAEHTRGLLRASLAAYVPGTAVWIYGSLVKPERFHEWSDVDVAFESLPPDMSLEYLQSLLSTDVGREVDVCLLDGTRLRAVIEREGERWIA
jgi:predicted nucleotidyltransferase